MKKQCIVMLLLLLSVAFCNAQIHTNDVPVALTWDPNPVEDNVAHYNLYIENATDPTQPLNVVDVGNTTLYQTRELDLFDHAVNEFKLTAVNDAGIESDYSESVFVYYDPAPKPPSVPKQFRLVEQESTSYVPVDVFGPVEIQGDGAVLVENAFGMIEYLQPN